MVGLRLFLPETWTGDEARLERAGVPAEYRSARAKSEIALAELDRLIAAGVRFGTVARRRRVRHGRRVPSGVERTRACLGGRHSPSIRRSTRATSNSSSPSPDAAGRANAVCPMSSPPALKSMLDPSEMAHARLAQGNQGTLESPLRRRPRARRRRAAATDRRQGHAAYAGRRSLARRRAARVRRAEALSRQPAGGSRPQDVGRDDQGALGLRAGSPAAQGRTRPRPLRRPLMARSSSPCADGYDRRRLPPASSSRRREWGKESGRPPSTDARRPYEKQSSPPWPALRPTDAHTAAGKSADRSIESAKEC